VAGNTGEVTLPSCWGQSGIQCSRLWISSGPRFMLT